MSQPSAAAGLQKPAQALAGLSLDDGWTVTRLLSAAPGATGGHFSVSYEVTRSVGAKTETAFLKALDFSDAQGASVPLVDALQSMTEAYTFERDLIMSCAAKNMRNVVRGVSAGQVKAPASQIDPMYTFIQEVPYIILEAADGDVRRALAASSQLDEAWSLRVAHGVANGIRQLHGAGVSHQDLKPSNVMTFSDLAKIGDLGRAILDDGTGKWDSLPFAGDHTYAPPEILYRYVIADAKLRTRLSDLYQLGSLVVFLYSGVGMTGQILARLEPAFSPRTWPNDYANVLPYVRNAYDRAISDFQGRVSPVIRDRLRQIVCELTEPDPALRGNRKADNPALRCSTERYVSAFDLLAKRAEHAMTALLSAED